MRVCGVLWRFFGAHAVDSLCIPWDSHVLPTSGTYGPGCLRRRSLLSSAAPACPVPFAPLIPHAPQSLCCSHERLLSSFALGSVWFGLAFTAPTPPHPPPRCQVNRRTASRHFHAVQLAARQLQVRAPRVCSRVQLVVSVAMCWQSHLGGARLLNCRGPWECSGTRQAWRGGGASASAAAASGTHHPGTRARVVSASNTCVSVVCVCVHNNNPSAVRPAQEGFASPGVDWTTHRIRLEANPARPGRRCAPQQHARGGLHVPRAARVYKCATACCRLRGTCRATSHHRILGLCLAQQGHMQRPSGAVGDTCAKRSMWLCMCRATKLEIAATAAAAAAAAGGGAGGGRRRAGNGVVVGCRTLRQVGIDTCSDWRLRKRPALPCLQLAPIDFLVLVLHLVRK